MNALGANQHSIACMSTRRLEDPGSEPLTFQLVEDLPAEPQPPRGADGSN